MSASEQFPDLFQLLGAYLHQDWRTEYPDAPAAVGAAIRDSTPVQRLRAVDQLDLILASTRTEQAAEDLVGQLCDYYPPGDGLTWLGWLSDLRHRLG